MNAGHHAPTNNSHSSLPSSFDDALQACAHGCSQYTHSSTTLLLSSRLAPGSPATYAQRQPIPATGPSNRAQARVLLFVSACAARSIAKHHTHTHTAVGWRYLGPESWKEGIIQRELAGHSKHIYLYHNTTRPWSRLLVTSLAGSPRCQLLYTSWTSLGCARIENTVQYPTRPSIALV